MHIMQQSIINSSAKLNNGLFINCISMSQNLFRVGNSGPEKPICLIFFFFQN